MTLTQEKENGGVTGKESGLRELNCKWKDANEKMEAVGSKLREAQECSTGQDFSLIGKLYLEKQEIEAELKSVTGVREIMCERRVIERAFDLAPGITIFIRSMGCCLTWCPRVEIIQETRLPTPVPVVFEDGEFKC